MSFTNAREYHTYQTHYLSAQITKDSPAEVSLGWLPAGAMVVGSGCGVAEAWSGTGDEAVDLGFRNAQEGHTDDPDAFSETIFDLDAGVGYTSGDVTSAANLPFTQPAEVFATVTNTDSTTGIAWLVVQYVVVET